MSELSEEYCPHCDEHVDIPDDIVSICMCGKEIYPCNACEYASNMYLCGSEDGKGCGKFPKESGGAK